MLEIVDKNVKGVAVYVNKIFSAYILFPTKSVKYDPDRPSGGSFSFGGGSFCLLISKNLMMRVESFGSHSWNGEDKTHKYEFSFFDGGENNSWIETGCLVYEYADKIETNDKAIWRIKGDEMKYEIQCIPLTPCMNAGRGIADDGGFNLNFKFPEVILSKIF